MGGSDPDSRDESTSRGRVLPQPPDQARLRNRLLANLSPDDFGRVRGHLTRIVVDAHDVLIEPGCAIERVYFPESGLVAYVSPGDVATEVGIVGREGFVGTSLTLGVDRVPLGASGEIAGEGFAIETSALMGAVESSASLRAALARFTHVLMMQTVSTVYANAHFTVEQRLARWLLMTHDRVDGDDLRLTHDFLAMMLCVRRPGVTVATHVLEGVGAIRAKRALITVLDRDKLTQIAGEGYGLAEAEYDRLLQPKIQAADLKAVV